jgi:hypothetical protein
VSSSIQVACHCSHHGTQVQPTGWRRSKPSDVRTAFGHPRTSLRYLMRLGPSSPSRFLRFSSYSL